MHFTATAVTGTAPFSYTWDFGGAGYGSGLDTATAVFTYTQEGSYTVLATMTNACGLDTVSDTVEVLCYAPEAAMSSNSPVVLGQPMLFTSTVTGTGPFTYSWDFGDGVGYSSAANPVYTYTLAGDYTVTLELGGLCGIAVISDVVSVELVTQFRVYLPVVTKGFAP